MRTEAAFDALVEAVAFYADPESYHAVFIMADRPAGDFADDLSVDHGHPDYDRAMPGAKARAALKLGPTLVAALAEVWEEGYATCLGDFDIAARREARSENPWRTEQLAEDHAAHLAAQRPTPAPTEES